MTLVSIGLAELVRGSMAIERLWLHQGCTRKNHRKHDGKHFLGGMCKLGYTGVIKGTMPLVKTAGKLKRRDSDVGLAILY